jgi:arginine exporter protein ArgO
MGAALLLVAIALHGLVTLHREPAAAPPSQASAGRFGTFLAITVANPLTIASFAAIAASLSLDGPPAAAAFAVGAGAGSAVWHLALPLGAARAGRHLDPAGRRVLAVGGRLAVIAFALHLGLSA